MVSGVSHVQVFGAQKYAVRVQVDPDALAARGIGIDEVQQRHRAEQHQLCPPASCTARKQAFTIQSNGQLTNAAAYRPLIVAYRNGTPVRLEQLATCSTAWRTTKSAAWYQRRARHHSGHSAASPAPTRWKWWTTSRSCCRSFARRFRRRCNLEIAFDASHRIRNSIDDVKFTLVLTVCLVVMVIFLFLRNISATLIPGVAVPLSIVGTFAAMYLLGYSLNNLSLMALTLSVGFVVDDAIVMLENIVRHMELGESRMEAAIAGFARDRLHHRLDDHLAGGRVHSGAVHGRHRGPAAARVFGHHRGGDSDFRLRFADLTPMLGSRFLRIDHGARHGVVYRRARRRLSTV